MAKNPFVFPIEPISDWIIIERLTILSVSDKKAKKSNIIMPEGIHSPKNVMELEKQRAEQFAKYENAESALLGEWDEHPNQGIVIAVGKGRHLDQELMVPIVDVKKGDHIYYRGKTGEPVIVKGKLYWAIKEYDIFAVVKKGSL